METSLVLKTQKRGDLVAEEVKRWIMERGLKPGDRLPKELELQKLFSVSKATTREALKSLEVQGLITINTGPAGGATVARVPLARAFQLLQNYLFFEDIGSEHLYAIRAIVEPELAAGAVPFLTEEDFAALERNIAFCAPVSSSHERAFEQRQSDLHFHDILADANPNPFLRFLSKMINEMLRQLITFGPDVSHASYQEFGRENVEAHVEILNAAKVGDAERVRTLMREHIEVAGERVMRLHGEVQRRFILDSDLASATPPFPADAHKHSK